MKKVIYTMDQIKEIASFINTLTVSGIDGCKSMAKVIDIIENPVDTIVEEGDGERNEP